MIFIVFLLQHTLCAQKCHKKRCSSTTFFRPLHYEKTFFGYAAIFSSSVKERRGKVNFVSYTKTSNLVFKKKSCYFHYNTSFVFIQIFLRKKYRIKLINACRSTSFTIDCATRFDIYCIDVIVDAICTAHSILFDIIRDNDCTVIST